MFTQLYNKCLKLAAHKNSNYFLGIISFIESSFFPIPPDVMIAPMAIAKKKDFLRIFLIHYKKFSRELAKNGMGGGSTPGPWSWLGPPR